MKEKKFQLPPKDHVHKEAKKTYSSPFGFEGVLGLILGSTNPKPNTRGLPEIMGLKDPPVYVVLGGPKYWALRIRA